MRSKILCIEDDLTIQTLIEESLRDFNVLVANNLKEAENQFKKNSFAAILLDVGLPDGDGLKFYAKISNDSEFKKIPTLFLTGHDDISTKLMAFSMGADDFITKPFDPLELYARVTSKIRKAQVDVDQKKTRKFGNIEIDFDRQKVFRIQNGQENDLNLTAIEIKILSLLSKRIEQVYSREQILDSVWQNTTISDRTVDSHIAHLRVKMSESNVIIDTVKNFGYRILIKNNY